MNWIEEVRVFVRLFSLACALCACLSFGAVTVRAEGPATRPALMVLLKLDDVTTNGAHGTNPVAPRWQKVAGFCEREQIKANFGIIGWSLETEAPAYFKWIKDWNDKGVIEFWNHGYKNRKGTDEPDEFGGSLESQVSALQNTQRLAREKLGLTLPAFGAHWSKTNEFTSQALAASPEIKVWFGASADRLGEGQTVLITDRLEQPTFIPNYENVVKVYNRVAKSPRPYLVLQGHPNKWDDERFETFTKIVAFLKDNGCRFVTVSEYLESVSTRKPS